MEDDNEELKERVGDSERTSDTAVQLESSRVRKWQAPLRMLDTLFGKNPKTKHL